MASERKPLTRNQRIALLILIITALIIILIGILILPHPSAAAAEEQPYNPIGVLFSIGIMCVTVMDGRSMAVHDKMNERCQNCVRFPGNEQKCAYDTIGRRVVYALDYGCGVWIKKGEITESMLMRKVEDMPEIEEKSEEY
jgi:hypothetical protein